MAVSWSRCPPSPICLVGGGGIKEFGTQVVHGTLMLFGKKGCAQYSFPVHGRTRFDYSMKGRVNSDSPRGVRLTLGVEGRPRVVRYTQTHTAPGVRRFPVRPGYLGRADDQELDAVVDQGPGLDAVVDQGLGVDTVVDRGPRGLGRVCVRGPGLGLDADQDQDLMQTRTRTQYRPVPGLDADQDQDLMQTQTRT